MSSDLQLVFISLCQAMVDVDETYREPLLGEAFYHEKALTISRVSTRFYYLCYKLGKIQQNSNARIHD